AVHHALRAAQHFDALNAAAEQILETRRNLRRGSVGDIHAVDQHQCAVRLFAADAQPGGFADAAVAADVDAGLAAQHIGDTALTALRDFFSVEHGNGSSHFPQWHRLAAGGDYQCFQRGGCGERVEVG